MPDAPHEALHGARAVARRLVSSFADRPVAYTVQQVNGEPGVVVRLGHRVVAVVTFTASPGRVDRIHAIGNPAKLSHLQ